MSNIRVNSNNTQFKGMVEMVGDANLLKTGAVGDQRRAVHADDDKNRAGGSIPHAFSL